MKAPRPRQRRGSLIDRSSLVRLGKLPRTAALSPTTHPDQGDRPRKPPKAVKRSRAFSGSGARGLPPGLLRRINEYLMASFRRGSPPRVGELIRTLDLSHDRFMQMLRGATGMTPSNYLKEWQIMAAKMLLLKTNMTMDKVAYATGFGTRRTFFREFRRLTGMSPATFREGS